MLDSVCPPPNCITCCCGHYKILGIVALFVFASLLHFIGLSLNILLQHLNFCNLRISIIHHFIQQLVGNHEVVA